jgi:hypothetical protein
MRNSEGHKGVYDPGQNTLRDPGRSHRDSTAPPCRLHGCWLLGTPDDHGVPPTDAGQTCRVGHLRAQPRLGWDVAGE